MATFLCLIYCGIFCALYCDVLCALYCDALCALCCDAFCALYCDVLCASYCDVFNVSWCILYIVMYFVYCDVFYILWCILCIVMCMNSRCMGPVVSGGTCVGLMYKFLSSCSYSTLHFTAFTHVCSVQCAQHTLGVMRAYWWRYTRILLCGTQGWELPVPWYHVIYGGVAYDVYVIYMSYVSINCTSCYSFPASSHNYKPPASRSKLICIVSVGSTSDSGTQSLLTSAQLKPSCSRPSVLSLTSLPDRCGCCDLRCHDWVTSAISYRLIINIISYVLRSTCYSFQSQKKAKTKTAVSIKSQWYRSLFDTLEQCDRRFQDFHGKEE